MRDPYILGVDCGSGDRDTVVLAQRLHDGNIVIIDEASNLTQEMIDRALAGTDHGVILVDPDNLLGDEPMPNKLSDVCSAIGGSLVASLTDFLSMGNTEPMPPRRYPGITHIDTPKPLSKRQRRRLKSKG